MKKLLLSAGAIIAGAAAYAGGLSDAITETVPEMVPPPAEPTSATGWIIPLVIVGALIAVAVSSGDDDEGGSLDG